MIDVPTVIALFGVLIFLAHLFSWIFSFTAIPDSLLLIVVGILLGEGLGILTPTFFGDFGNVILTVTLVIILFEAGTTLRIGSLKEALSGTLRLTLVTFILTVLGAGTFVWWLTDLPFLVSLMFGAVVGGTTSAVVVSLLDTIQVDPASRALLILESAVSDVLSIVVTIALLSVFETGAVQLLDVSLLVIVSFVYASVVGVVGGLTWSLLLDKVRHVRNSLFITPAFIFLLFGLVEALGFSGPIMALAFGVTLGNIGALKHYLEQRHGLLYWLVRPVSLSRRERAFFSEIVFLLGTFFFVYIGLSITITNRTIMLLGLATTVVLLVLRFVAVHASVSRETSIPAASLMSALVPKGLAAAVLASLLVQRDVPSGLFVQELAYSVIFWSIGLTSLLVFLQSRTRLRTLYAWLFRRYSAQSRLAEAPDIPQRGPA